MKRLVEVFDTRTWDRYAAAYVDVDKFHHDGSQAIAFDVDSPTMQHQILDYANHSAVRCGREAWRVTEVSKIGFDGRQPIVEVVAVSYDDEVAKWTRPHHVWAVATIETAIGRRWTIRRQPRYDYVSVGTRFNTWESARRHVVELVNAHNRKRQA